MRTVAGFYTRPDAVPAGWLRTRHPVVWRLLAGATTIARIAITRAVSRALEHCELTHLPRRPIDIELARRQHSVYERALRDAGCEVRRLAELPEQADSVFVEDTVIVLDDVAVITRPGAASRRAETESMATALAGLRKLVHVQAPATIDGGDVLRLGRVLHVGASARSSIEGISQLADLVEPFGYRVEAVPLHGCLHLKSAVTRVAQDRLLLNPEWVDAGCFPGFATTLVDPAEPQAANALRIGDVVIHPASCPRTAERLRETGLEVVGIDMSETEKAEGGVTCCSVIFDA